MSELTELEHQARRWYDIAGKLPTRYYQTKQVAAKRKETDQAYQALLTQEFAHRDNENAWTAYRKYQKQRNYYQERAQRYDKDKLKQVRDRLKELSQEL